MRKWQQDLAITSANPSGSSATASSSASEEALDTISYREAASPTRDPARDTLRDSVRNNTIWQKAIAMTPLHWSGIVFVSTIVLLLIFQPFFVQTSSKERPYEAPTVSYITVFILAALAALGHQLSLGGD